MVARIDITHQRYGRLVAVERVATAGRHRSVWRFKCDCGEVVDRVIDPIRSGLVNSCGCIRKEKTSARAFVHGHRRYGKSSKTLMAYEKAKSRCNNPNDARYRTYGERGIKMCDRWMQGFSNFLADMGECPEGLTLERIDNNSGYTPGNCRWATREDQAKNKTNNVIVYHEGERLILADFARLMNVEYKKLRHLVSKRKIDAHEACRLIELRRKKP